MLARVPHRRNHQVVPVLFARRRTAHCDSVWTSVTSQDYSKDRYRFHWSPTPQTNWAAQGLPQLDLHTGYYNVRVAAGHECKTAFRTRYGSFEILVMPMGLTKCSRYVSSLHEPHLRDMTDIFVVIYFDDILIFPTLWRASGSCRRVLDRLREYDLHSKPKKCLVPHAADRILGLHVTPTGISMDTAKTDAVSAWPTPANLRQSRRLRLANSIADSLWGLDIVIP